MTDDDKTLVERLRSGVPCCDPDAGNGEGSFFVEDADETMHEAADRIEALSAENERLREALTKSEAFCQEVSDALEKRGFYIDDRDLGRFIIPKPDPLEKLIQSIAITLDANDLREALDEAGLEIKEKGE